MHPDNQYNYSYCVCSVRLQSFAEASQRSIFLFNYRVLRSAFSLFKIPLAEYRFVYAEYSMFSMFVLPAIDDDVDGPWPGQNIR